METNLIKLLTLICVVFFISSCGGDTGAARVFDAETARIREAIMKDYRKHRDEPDSIFNYAILKMVDTPSASDLHEAISCLSDYLQHRPEDLTAQMSMGYASVLLADLYLARKNYFKAAEYSKRGFYLMDEAVEQEPDNISIRFMRGRFDAQAHRKLGRYVVAVKDLEYLLENRDRLPEGMEPACLFLLAKALLSAGDEMKAQEQLVALKAAYPQSPLSETLPRQEIPIAYNEIRSMLRLPTPERE